MKLKVYVASGSDERSVAAGYMARLKEAGIELTLDWNAEVEANGGKANRGLSEYVRLKAARADVCAVEEADVFWLIVPNGASAGCWFEMGVAYKERHLSDLVIVASGDVEKSIFTSLADMRFETHEEAFMRIVSMAKS